jgi:predicted nucleotidyltransferase
MADIFVNKRNDKIVEWAVKRIEKEYKDDVSLLLTYGSYENGTANSLSDVDFYFIPKIEHAYELCKTFIVEGIGFDLFPMSWKRVEGLAELNECLTPCLANVKVLFCNSEEDKRRFEKLQNRLRKNLNNKVFMLDKAFKKMEMAMNFYQTMLFEEDICEIRTLAGYIAMSLSDAVAYGNKTYFSRGLKKQIEDLKNMKSTPEGFVFLYESIIKANSEGEVKECCHKIIKNTRSFLDSKNEKSEGSEKEANYENLAELYEEIISAWNKIYVCCDNGDAVLAYISGTCLQRELNIAARENGLDKPDLMSAYNAEHLEQFKQRARELQNEFVKVIEENGGNIETYNTVEEFIKKN